METLVLASGSPRRRELLSHLGIPFVVRPSEADETYSPDQTPEEIVASISRKKALAAQSAPQELVLAADTMVFLDQARLGKPRDRADALAMLTALQGRQHTVCTGVTVRRGAKILTQVESTAVWFRSASQTELQAYIDTGEPMDKAGAYGIQGLGSLFIERIDGDFYNVMGLPLLRLSRMLAVFGLNLL